MSKSHPSFAGVDVSARALRVALSSAGQAVKQATFDNDPPAHKRLLKWLTKGGRTVCVCLEATGLYSLEVALALHHHRRTHVMVVNPKAMHNDAQARMQRAKTDAMDALLILDDAQRMPFVAWQPPSEHVLQLQALTRRMEQLKQAIIRERNRSHAQGYPIRSTHLIARDIQGHIRHLKRRIQYLQAQALDWVKQDLTLKRAYQRLCSVRGIAQTSAWRLLDELALLPQDMKPSQGVAHAGLDPKPKQSGTANPPRRISKTGNKYLRHALYMPAWVAYRHEVHVKAFYDKLMARGKKPLQAIVAVMRKLLHSIWGMLRHDQDFEGEKFYRITSQTP